MKAREEQALDQEQLDHGQSEGGGRATSVGAASPIRIRVGDQGVRGGREELETMAEGSLDVPNNTLDQREVLISRIMHVEADLLNRIRNIWAREG
jgi:hypothetical protein